MTASNPLDVFISYAPADEAQRRELEKHLAALTRQGLIRPWHVGLVVAGQEHDTETAAQLATARLILLLVSADYLDAHWTEMERALARHAVGEARVIPLIIKACDWEHAPFAKLWPLPSNRQPVASWPIQSEAWADIARGIRAAVELFEALPIYATVPALSRGTAWRSPDPPQRSASLSYATADGRNSGFLTGSPGAGSSPVATSATSRFQANRAWPQRSNRSYLWFGLAAGMLAITIIASLSASKKQTHYRSNEDAQQELERLLAIALEGDDASAEAGQASTTEEIVATPATSDELDPMDVPVELIEFYEGNRGSGRMLGRIVQDSGQRLNLVENRNVIGNDKARSCVLYSVRVGAVISIFDSPSGDRAQDWVVIAIKKPHPRYTIATFESDIDDDYVQVKRMKKHKLDGKVSRIEVD